MFKQKGYTSYELIVVIVFLAAAGGWIANVVKVAGVLMTDDAIVWTGMLVFRIIGIFAAPLGVVLGYIPV